MQMVSQTLNIVVTQSCFSFRLQRRQSQLDVQYTAGRNGLRQLTTEASICMKWDNIGFTLHCVCLAICWWPSGKQIIEWEEGWGGGRRKQCVNNKLNHLQAGEHGPCKCK